jgi:hypothetical protein
VGRGTPDPKATIEHVVNRAALLFTNDTWLFLDKIVRGIVTDGILIAEHCAAIGGYIFIQSAWLIHALKLAVGTRWWLPARNALPNTGSLPISPPRAPAQGATTATQIAAARISAYRVG